MLCILFKHACLPVYLGTYALKPGRYKVHTHKLKESPVTAAGNVHSGDGYHIDGINWLELGTELFIFDNLCSRLYCMYHLCLFIVAYFFVSLLRWNE